MAEPPIHSLVSRHDRGKAALLVAHRSASAALGSSRPAAMRKNVVAALRSSGRAYGPRAFQPAPEVLRRRPLSRREHSTRFVDLVRANEQTRELRAAESSPACHSAPATPIECPRHIALRRNSQRPAGDRSHNCEGRAGSAAKSDDHVRWPAHAHPFQLPAHARRPSTNTSLGFISWARSSICERFGIAVDLAAVHERQTLAARSQAHLYCPVRSHARPPTWLPEGHAPDPQPSTGTRTFRKQMQLHAGPARCSGRSPALLSPHVSTDRKVFDPPCHVPPTHAPTPEDRFRRH